jgi:hypothetical protein
MSIFKIRTTLYLLNEQPSNATCKITSGMYLLVKQYVKILPT